MSKNIKVTKDEFDRFVNSLEFWLSRLGLQGYQTEVEQAKLKNVYADLGVLDNGRLALFRFASKISKLDKDMFSPENCAKHEALHLLLRRLRWLGEKRYVLEGDLYEEEEKVVRVLEKVVGIKL